MKFDDIGFSGPSIAAAVAAKKEPRYKIRLEKRRRGSTVPANASLLVVSQFVCPPAHPGGMDLDEGFMERIYLCSGGSLDPVGRG